MNKKDANEPIYSIKFKKPINYMGLFVMISFSIICLMIALPAIFLHQDYPFGIALLLGVIFVNVIGILVGIPKTIEVNIYKDKIQFSDWYGHFSRHYPLFTISKSKIEYITRGVSNLSINLKEVGEKNYNCIPIQGLPKKNLEELIHAIEKIGIEMRQTDYVTQNNL
jgi:hypothetical protein